MSDPLEECKHEITRANCTICTPRKTLQPARLSAGWGPWFRAGYEGECSECPADIVEGDQIRADGEGGWLCEACGSDESSETAPLPPSGPSREELNEWW